MKKLLSILVLAALLTSCIQGPKAQKKPNIIYVLADDLGYGDVAAFNDNGKIRTPNLDQMASEGMRFTDAHTSSSVCTPTRYGILTGRYNWRSRLKSSVLSGESDHLIPNDRSTVASVLKASGYHTAYIGKWHLGWDWARFNKDSIDFSKPVKNNPNDLGFDYAYGHCGSLDMAPYVYVENGMPTAIPTEYTVNEGKQSWWRRGLTAPDFVHDDVTPNFFRRAIEYVTKQSETEQPFFLYLPLPSPHTPILPTEEYKGKSGLDNDYGDFVMLVDGYMGKLLNKVKELGIEENTLIIFTSDNGCSPQADFKDLASKGHHPSGGYRGHKADIFEGGHRVPFIAKWPKVIEAGSKSDRVICTTDLVATCADITGYSLNGNEGEDSYSMLPLFRQKTIEGTYREATVHHSINGSFAIRKGDWKLIMCPGSGGWSFPRPDKDEELLKTMPPVQLYNLKNDPVEKINLQSEFPDKVDELKALLTKYIVEGRSTAGEVQSNDGNKIWKQLWWIRN